MAGDRGVASEKSMRQRCFVPSQLWQVTRSFYGVEKVQGDVVITMDADLQDSPDEIPELYRMITQDGYDLVSGWKKKRYDPLSKTIPTKLFNATARKVSGIKLHDFNCGLKAYRREVVKVYRSVWRHAPLHTLSGQECRLYPHR